MTLDFSFRDWKDLTVRLLCLFSPFRFGLVLMIRLLDFGFIHYIDG